MEFDFTLLEPLVAKGAWLLVFILLDVLGGVTRSLFITKDFKWEKLAGFLQTYVPYVVGWIMAEALSIAALQMNVDWLPSVVTSNIGTVVYMVVMLTALGSILGHLASFGVLKDQFGKVGVGNEDDPVG